MRASINNSGIIFSVYRDDKTEKENVKSHVFIRDNLLTASGYHFKEITGYYNGKYEQSFLVVDNNGHDDIHEIFDLIKDIAEKYHQECILTFDYKNHADLVYLSNKKIEYLGVLTNVSEYEALKHNSYTYDTFTGYWITK